MVFAPLPRPAALLAADSATVALQGAAGAMVGQLNDPFAMPGWQRGLSNALNGVLPVTIKMRIMHEIASGTAVPAELASAADPQLIAKWMTSLYPDSQPDRQYDGAILGAPSGAAAHLSSLLGFPMFSQHVLTGVRDHFPVDDTVGYIAKCSKVASSILKRHPDFSAVIHHDPLHDRFLVGRIGFIRLKYKRVPLPIREWISRNVKPGGSIVILDCGYPWLQSLLPQVHPECWLQVGGLGDVTPEDFIGDGADLRDYRLKHGGIPTPWGAPGATSEWRPESEWGTLPEYRDDAIAWADGAGYRPVVVPFEHPDELTTLAFNGFRNLWPDVPRVYLDCFTHSCPAFNRYAQAAPLWLPFLGQDSRRLAERLLQDIPTSHEILISLHPSFADPGDLTTVADWESTLKGRKVTWLGVDRATYPADLGAYGRYRPSLDGYLKSHGMSHWHGETLEVEALESLIES